MSDPIPIDLRRRGGPPGPPEINPKMLLIAGVVALAGLGIYTSFYQVGPESAGVVLRLGKFNGPLRPPGLHMQLPFGIDQVRIVPTQRQLKEEFGFRTESAGVNTQYSRGNFEYESLMLTGDLNVVVVEWTVQYRIEPGEQGAYNYLFRVKEPRDTFRFMAQAVMREIVGDRTVDDVLTVGRTELAAKVKEDLKELCRLYEIGLVVDQVILQDVTPPDKVKASFNEVNQAQQDKERRINEAQAEFNREVPKAEGTAKQQIEQARGYAVSRVNRAKGDANRFSALAAAYALAPEVTRRRIYLETMQQVLPKVGRKVIVDPQSSNLLQLLDLSPKAGPAVAPGGQR